MGQLNANTDEWEIAVDRLNFREPIGRGAFGSVWRALLGRSRGRRGNRTVAAKCYLRKYIFKISHYWKLDWIILNNKSSRCVLRYVMEAYKSGNYYWQYIIKSHFIFISPPITCSPHAVVVVVQYSKENSPWRRIFCNVTFWETFDGNFFIWPQRGQESVRFWGDKNSNHMSIHGLHGLT